LLRTRTVKLRPAGHRAGAIIGVALTRAGRRWERIHAAYLCLTMSIIGRGSRGRLSRTPQRFVRTRSGSRCSRRWSHLLRLRLCLRGRCLLHWRRRLLLLLLMRLWLCLLIIRLLL
jgi:hypothetical protein